MSEPSLPRGMRRRLAIIRHAEEITDNVAMTCRYYGISRQCYISGTPLPGPTASTVARLLQAAAGQPGPRMSKSWRAHPSAPALPLRAGQDRDVPQALARGADQSL